MTIRGENLKNYFIESDAVPAFYNSHRLGHTNRTGNAFEFNVEEFLAFVGEVHFSSFGDFFSFLSKVFFEFFLFLGGLFEFEFPKDPKR